MQTRHQDKKKYFEEQVYTTQNYVLPFIQNVIDLKPGSSVLEIGCGEGGNMVPFLDLGFFVTGIDLSESKINDAKKFMGDNPNYKNVKLIAKDIYLAEMELSDQFDLIIMRDVIEHIHDQEKFMGYVKRFLKPDGAFFLAFPPWYNPFGGHQQICRNKLLSKLPYFHLSPSFLYRFLLKIGGEPQTRIEELLEIKDTGISIERFDKILKKTNYHVISKKNYLFNPNYYIKFKLKPREQFKMLQIIPFIRDLFTTACYYLVIEKK